jgi:hypothetical protein
VDSDLPTGRDPVPEHVPAHQLGLRDLGEQTQQLRYPHPVVPLGVPPDLEHRGVRAQHQGHLFEERRRVGVDLLRREDRPGLGAAGRVTDARGQVAEQEHDLMAEVLQLPHHPQVDRVPEMKVRCGAVDAVLDPQGPAGLQPVAQIVLADDGVGGAV